MNKAYRAGTLSVIVPAPRFTRCDLATDEIPSSIVTGDAAWSQDAG